MNRRVKICMFSHDNRDFCPDGLTFMTIKSAPLGSFLSPSVWKIDSLPRPDLGRIPISGFSVLSPYPSEW